MRNSYFKKLCVYWIKLRSASEWHRCDCLDEHSEVHAYIITHTLGWKCHSRMKHMFFILESRWLVGMNSAYNISAFQQHADIYANTFQMNICVRMIIFNGCRVSRLTVLFVLSVSVGKTLHRYIPYVHLYIVSETSHTHSDYFLPHKSSLSHYSHNDNVHLIFICNHTVLLAYTYPKRLCSLQFAHHIW